MASALESTYRPDRSGGYPPYDIKVTGDDTYRISMAIGGFSEQEMDVQVKESVLTVSGAHKEDTKEKERRFLHRGIATRNFEHRFHLADYVKVVDARIRDGLLHIDLVREIPEAMKPRKIEIRTGGSLLEGEAERAAA